MILVTKWARIKSLRISFALYNDGDYITSQTCVIKQNFNFCTKAGQ